MKTVLLIALTVIEIVLGYKISSNLEYNITDSRKYAAYSAVAFCPKQCVQSWSCGTVSKYTLTNVTYIENTVTKAVCYVGYDPQNKAIVTAWRGSCNAQNWYQDFNFELEPYQRCKQCYIHVGFIADYRLNEKRLLSAINKIKSQFPVEKIICTGHSLGAALSTINGIQLAIKYPSLQINIHNFGCPRIGNEKLAQFITFKTNSYYRVVHNRDLFPHLPPEGVYKHASTQVFFDSDMINYKVCDSSGQDKSCSNKFFPAYTPDDHDFYFEHISSVKC